LVVVCEIFFSFFMEWFSSPVSSRNACIHSYRSSCEVSIVFIMLLFGSHCLPFKCRFCCTCNIILLFFVNCRFQLENNQRITVQDYFLHMKNVTLKYPDLPCLHVGSLARETPIYLPSEVRKI